LLALLKFLLATHLVVYYTLILYVSRDYEVAYVVVIGYVGLSGIFSVNG